MTWDEIACPQCGSTDVEPAVDGPMLACLECGEVFDWPDDIRETTITTELMVWLYAEEWLPLEAVKRIVAATGDYGTGLRHPDDVITIAFDEATAAQVRAVIGMIEREMGVGR